MNDVKALRSLLIASLLAVATSASAQDPNPWKFEFHGFVTGSMFIQNQVFAGGTGQDNLLLAPAPSQAAPAEPTPPATPTNGTASKSGTFLGADVRQSRWIFAMTGPQAFGGTPKVYFEGDFYGQSASGAGLAAIEHTQLRLRAAFGELKWGNTQLQIGQYSAQLILAQLSASVAHIANPITFGTGTIGGRAMGVRVVHGMPMGDMKLELAGEVLAAKYNDPVRGATVASISQAWAATMPQLGGRATLSGKSGGLTYSAYLSGLYESVNLKGFGDSVVNGGAAGVVLADGSRKTSISPYAVEVGGRFAYSLVSLSGNYYMGSGTGVWAGGLNQQGEIDGSGFWAQLGIQPNPMFGVYALYGMGSADEKQTRNWGGNRKENTLLGGILRVSDGGYTFAAEYYQMETTWLTGTFAAPGANVKTDGYQFIVSGHYAF